MTFVLLAALGGCTYDEQIPEREIKGKLVVPRAAATREVKATDDPNDFTTTPVTDPRLIGPIYLGAFSGIDETSKAYPLPVAGPVIGGEEGNSFPYGGTTVGHYDFACYKVLACKVVTGRFTDYADMLDYFANVLRNPVKDDGGDEVLSDVAFQQYCYDYYEYTADWEMSFIGGTDFVENSDGDFEAEFSMYHTYFQSGMALWGFMDAPQINVQSPAANGTFSTCDLNGGRQQYRYDQTFYEGSSQIDVLNKPRQYLASDDWVSSPAFIQDENEEPVIHLDIPVSEE